MNNKLNDCEQNEWVLKLRIKTIKTLCEYIFCNYFMNVLIEQKQNRLVALGRWIELYQGSLYIYIKLKWEANFSEKNTGPWNNTQKQMCLNRYYVVDFRNKLTITIVIVLLFYGRFRNITCVVEFYRWLWITFLTTRSSRNSKINSNRKD